MGSKIGFGKFLSLKNIYCFKKFYQTGLNARFFLSRKIKSFYSTVRYNKFLLSWDKICCHRFFKPIFSG